MPELRGLRPAVKEQHGRAVAADPQVDPDAVRLDGAALESGHEVHAGFLVGLIGRPGQPADRRGGRSFHAADSIALRGLVLVRERAAEDRVDVHQLADRRAQLVSSRFRCPFQHRCLLM